MGLIINDNDCNILENQDVALSLSFCNDSFINSDIPSYSFELLFVG